MGSAERANAPRCISRAGTYEAWFVTVNDEKSRRGFWIRYTSFSPGAGSAAAPHSALWAFAFDHEDPHLNWGAKQTFPLGTLQAAANPFRLQLKDAWMDGSGCAGGLRSDRGSARWDLRWVSREPVPFPFLDPRFEGLSSVSNVGAKPCIAVTGTVEIGGRAHRLEQAWGGQQHTWGTSHALEWNWGFAAGPDHWMDGATSRIRSRLGRALSGTSVGSRIGAESFRFNAVWRVLRARGRISCDGWKASASLKGRRLDVSVMPRREDLLGVAYDDPAGGRRYCYHTEVADLELVLATTGREPVRIVRPASAAFEYASEKPLAGTTVSV